MVAKNRSLHGNAPDKSADALILIDVINDLDVPGSESLLKYALPMARHIAKLSRKARAAHIPVIYVNDNFGRWRSDFVQLFEHCLSKDCKGQPLAELLRPEADDYFVLKPKHSGFFASSLEILLRYLEVDRLILTGVASNICVLFTANDAYMRDFDLVVPKDCVAANTAQLNRDALHQMESVLKADIRASTRLSFRKNRGKKH